MGVCALWRSLVLSAVLETLARGTSRGAMMEGYGLANQASANYPMEKLASMPTLAQRLDMAVQQAEERLAAVKRAREIFEKNPDLEELLNIMQRMHF
jgi:hypothetical protein